MKDYFCVITHLTIDTVVLGFTLFLIGELNYGTFIMVFMNKEQYLGSTDRVTIGTLSSTISTTTDCELPLATAFINSD